MSKPSRRRASLLALIPLALFVALAVLFYARLGAGDPSEVPSALIGKPVPDFHLEGVAGLTRDGAPVPGLSAADLAQGVSVVNVFASWCAPCRAEHPLLADLAKDQRIRLYGLNYKDGDDQALRFLNGLGNPYAAIGADRNGRVGIDWGVYGVPETFVVAGGRIAAKLVGPLTPERISGELMPAIDKAVAAQAAL
ncbi:periplasmic thioredoxin of cytochrome c-type biogenesis [uncultured Pleomorphomonas sp.]|uniref:Periplasmic thioredoxin of cytochrome c-type biogenesis n=1 Tax=uncultured Pleomorphomonas sp. TaxID=442121 RepID=A0A212LK34_9HYPH|nr:DsbE family thiol:disulfide interchange protein [uncultured Pleomorphomonas sp.]SCM77905.1 periplasmic thioredoxin of cytochrome c-type biogenesis [uncultured Pleomorphomonas sp.]